MDDVNVVPLGSKKISLGESKGENNVKQGPFAIFHLSNFCRKPKTLAKSAINSAFTAEAAGGPAEPAVQ